MSRRRLSLILAGAMIASVFSALPAKAEIKVPAEPNVVDPKGDANYANDGNTLGLAGGRNNATGQDASSAGDILAIWFTDDADNVYAHMQTEGPGPATSALFYRVRVDPGVGAACLWFRGVATGAGNVDGGGGSLQNSTAACGSGTVREGAEFIQEAGPDGTGIHTIKIPRALSPHLADGVTFTGIFGEVTHLGAAGGSTLTAPTIDNTLVGTDYKVGSGGGAPAPGPDPDPAPGPDPAPDPEPSPSPDPGDDEPKKKDCSKKKGKAKKKCKKYNKNLGNGGGGGGGGETPMEPPATPPGKGCDAYVPGDLGAEAESLVVTDEHTAEAPLEFKMTHGVGAVIEATDVFANIQVDTEGAEAGLFISYEFPVYEDHDLTIYYADGATAASVGGFNQAPFVPGETDGTGNGGHSEQGAEILDGLRTADCAGYTAKFHNFLGEGGEYTAKIWLGEPENDPA